VVPAVPVTVTGKNLEVTAQNILGVVTAEKAADSSAMANPESLDYLIEYARKIRD
jgi:hypothetical protein